MTATVAKDVRGWRRWQHTSVTATGESMVVMALAVAVGAVAAVAAPVDGFMVASLLALASLPASRGLDVRVDAWGRRRFMPRRPAQGGEPCERTTAGSMRCKYDYTNDSRRNDDDAGDGRERRYGVTNGLET